MQLLEEKKYTVGETAKILGCSKSQVKFLLRTGQLRGYKLSLGKSGKWRIYESSILEFIIENDSFVNFLDITDFSHLDEKVLIERLRKKIFKVARNDSKPSR